MSNNQFGLNINVIKSYNPINKFKLKTDKKKQLMRKPLPFNMNFWKNNNPLSLPRSDQSREYLINKSNKPPIVLTRPFNKKVILFISIISIDYILDSIKCKNCLIAD